jgi:hypothetical protein
MPPKLFFVFILINSVIIPNIQLYRQETEIYRDAITLQGESINEFEMYTKLKNSGSLTPETILNWVEGISIHNPNPLYI